jgi:hypothetical protein
VWIRRRIVANQLHGPVSITGVCCVNIAAVVLESVPCYEAANGGLFAAIEGVSLAMFTLE